ncbi:MAG: GNAT family N-acetyltransferase [Thermoplasmatota archaeon]
MIKIEKGERDPEFLKMRDVFLDEICEPVELYSEMFCMRAPPYFFIKDGERIGYVLFGEDNAIHEFYIRNEYVPLAPEVFKRFLEEYPVEKAIVQSWDHHFMTMCLLHFSKKKVLGFNFRDRVAEFGPFEKFEFRERRATMEDHDLILKHREGIFDDTEVKHIPFWIRKSEIIIFENDRDEFIGYGLLNRTLESRDWFDVGMYVHPDHRKMGIGAWIIDNLVQRCLEREWRPVAGCAVSNTGSKRTLEKAGFVSKHVIVEFWD